MIEFFMAVASTIRRAGVDVAVAVTVYPRNLAAREVRALKTALPGIALAQLDDNVRAKTGKSIGRPTLMLDIDGTSKPGPIATHSYTAWTRMAPGSPENNPHIYHSASPTYVLTNSAHSRLIQAADIAAYFVAKYLALFGDAIDQKDASDLKTVTLRSQKIADGNVALTIWDALDTHVILVRCKSTWDNELSWMHHFWEPLRAPFEHFRDRLDTFLWSLRIAGAGRHPTVGLPL